MNDELKRLHAENATKAAQDAEIVKAQIRQRLERILKREQASGHIPAHVTVDDWLRDEPMKSYPGIYETIEGDDDAAH